MQVKITLDTNCIINLLDDKSVTRTSYSDLEYILSLVGDGLVAAFVTTRVVADQSSDPDRNRVASIAAQLLELPVETIGVGFRLDVSMLDGSDFLGNDEIMAINNELTRLLSPNGLNSSDNTFSNRINDIDHLIGHYQSNNDVFITDDRGMLKKADSLRNLLGITVMSPANFASYARNRIQVSLAGVIATDDQAYSSRPCEGSVVFDYSNNNGLFSIGQGLYSFETKWSKASDTSIYAYGDGRNIDAIAIAKNIASVSDIADAATFDYSSRIRTVKIGEVLLLRNSSGSYAAIHVTNIQDDSRGAPNDLIAFDYKIASINSSRFTRE